MIIDSFITDHFKITEYMQSITDIMDDTIPQTLNEEQVACVITRVLYALSYLSKTSTIHGRIQASSILLSEMGNIKLGK